jgi:hypothetical protein
MGGASTGGSDTSDEKKQDSYSTQFKKNYKVKKDGTVKKKNVVEKAVESGGVVLNLIKNNPLSKHTEKVNRDFFDTKVKKAGKSKYDNYEDYIKARGRGEVDAYGREITNTGGGNDNNNQPILEASAQTLPANNVTAPTNAEVTQASSTTMSADEILVANKKKGKSNTILQTAQGLGNSTANTTKKTLGA